MNIEHIDLFKRLVHLAAADQKFTEEEIAFLITRAERWGIPNEEFENTLAAIQTDELQLKVPETHEERIVMLKEMIRLMAVDGELAEKEKQICAQASATVGLTSIQFGELLEEVIRERA